MRPALATDFSKQPLVKFKNHLYYEDKDHTAEAERNLKPAPGSKIRCYLNGQSKGVAFQDIYDGVYYPAISLYKTAKVTVNFGPGFKHPPRDIKSYRPMSDAATQAMLENSLSDILFHIENEGKLPDFQA